MVYNIQDDKNQYIVYIYIQKFGLILPYICKHLRNVNKESLMKKSLSLEIELLYIQEGLSIFSSLGAPKNGQDF